MVFFTNPPYSNTSNYSTLAEVYNMRKAITESEQKNTEHMARILRELKKLRPRASCDVAQDDEDAEKRDVGKRGVGKTQGRTATEKGVQTPEEKDAMESYASDIKSIKEAVSDIAKRLSALGDMTASQQRQAACATQKKHRVCDMSDDSDGSDGSIELLRTPDCVRP